MIRYCLTIFLSAFLLFQIQPMIARFILPTFGGTAAVWTTCMMFFQITLFFGYLYAHLLRSRTRPLAAWLIHAGVILVAASVLLWQRPTASSLAVMSDHGGADLNWTIVSLLARTIGLPFFVLSTTGPLVQAWQATSHPFQSPFRLYALSNLGAVLALASYPFVIEPWLPLSDQVSLWTIGFLIFSVLAFWSGRQTIATANWTVSNAGERTDDQAAATLDLRKSASTPGTWPLWVLLSATSSVVLLATTNLMCQEVASIPFLWIVPLMLYLLSFIICFDRPKWYRRRFFMLFLAASSIAAILLIHLDVHAGLLLQVGGLSSVCFFACMVCHGELENAKPSLDKLTFYYLVIAIGGAIGGIFVSVIAPRVFDGFYEFQMGLGIALVVSIVSLYRLRKRQALSDTGPNGAVPSNPTLGFDINRALTTTVGVCVFLALAIVGCSLMYFVDPNYQKGLVFRDRNDYGITAVVDNVKDGQDYRTFVSGRVVHGGQSKEASKTLDHASYYIPGSGVGVAFESLREIEKRPLKIGVLGLGAGAMSTWFQEGDRVRYYEINPMVVQVAEKYFSFLDQSRGEKVVITGDGRIELTKELKASGSHQFDLLIMDAFSSDSVPVHLLTEECFDLYNQHVAEDGILLIHISNHYIDLLPVVVGHRESLSMTPVLIDYEPKNSLQASRWVLFTRNEDVLKSSVVLDASHPFPDDLKAVHWTDDYSSVASQLKWSARVDLDSILKFRATE